MVESFMNVVVGKVTKGTSTLLELMTSWMRTIAQLISSSNSFLAIFLSMPSHKKFPKYIDGKVGFT